MQKVKAHGNRRDGSLSNWCAPRICRVIVVVCNKNHLYSSFSQDKKTHHALVALNVWYPKYIIITVRLTDLIDLHYPLGPHRLLQWEGQDPRCEFHRPFGWAGAKKIHENSTFKLTQTINYQNSTKKTSAFWLKRYLVSDRGKAKQRPVEPAANLIRSNWSQN